MNQGLSMLYHGEYALYFEHSFCNSVTPFHCMFVKTSFANNKSSYKKLPRNKTQCTHSRARACFLFLGTILNFGK
jgi:hypothetical protein